MYLCLALKTARQTSSHQTGPANEKKIFSLHFRTRYLFAEIGNKSSLLSSLKSQVHFPLFFLLPKQYICIGLEQVTSRLFIISSEKRRAGARSSRVMAFSAPIPCFFFIREKKRETERTKEVEAKAYLFMETKIYRRKRKRPFFYSGCSLFVYLSNVEQMQGRGVHLP